MALTAAKWSISGLSVELKRDKRIIARIIDEGNVEPAGKKSGHPVYYMADIIGALIGSDALDLQQERAKLAKKQTEKTEIQIDQLRGVLVDASEIEEAWLRVATAVKARVLSIPTKAAGEAMAAGTLQEVQDVLMVHVREALTELATGN